MKTTREPRAQEVGQFLRERRVELRMSLLAVHKAGGPSRQTQRNWEAGLIPLGADPNVQRAYEEALQLPKGHLERLFNGEAVSLPREGRVEQDVWRVSSVKLREMMSQIDRLRTQAENPDATELKRIAAQMTTLQADILMQVLTNSPPGQPNTDDATSGNGGFSVSGD